MNYHWELINGEAEALFPEGMTWDGALLLTGPAVIHMVGPYLVPNPTITYQVSGPLVEISQSFDSLQEAKNAVEVLLRSQGDTVNGY